MGPSRNEDYRDQHRSKMKSPPTTVAFRRQSYNHSGYVNRQDSKIETRNKASTLPRPPRKYLQPDTLQDSPSSSSPDTEKRVTTIQTFQFPMSNSFKYTDGPRLLTASSDKMFLTARPLSRRSVPSTSPLAQYDNHFSSFFGSNTNARIYRTPVQSPSPHFWISDDSRNRTLSRNDKRTNVPDDTHWNGSVGNKVRTTPTKNLDTLRPAKPTTGARKSALRRPGGTSSRGSGDSRSPRARLRVSFDESTYHVKPAKEDKSLTKNYEGDNVRIVVPRSPDRYQTASPSCTPTGRKILTPQRPASVQKQETQLPFVRAPKESRWTTPVPTTDTAATGALTKSTKTEIRVAKPTPTLTRERLINSNRTFPTLKLQTPGYKEPVVVLSADQLLIRKSVEKVQRWIETLPRHFTTIHHVLRPVQQDY